MHLYNIYTHVCKKNMFHTFQRAEPDKIEKLKHWGTMRELDKKIAKLR